MDEPLDFDFTPMFAAAKGDPVVYRGERIYRADKVDARLGEIFTVTIEATNSKYVQGVGVQPNVRIYGETDKRAVVFEHFSVPPERRHVERSRLPFAFEVECRNKQGSLWFYNMCLRDGRQEWWNWACAMKRETIDGGYRYRCNDWQPNDDFTDIVFTIVRRAG